MRKLSLLALLACLFVTDAARADYVNVGIGYQENWVSVSSFTGATSIANAVLATTTVYKHRSFAVSNTCALDMAVVIVPPGYTLSSASISPLYVFTGLYRIVDNGSDQVVIQAGSKIYLYAPGGTAPTGCKVVIDQLL